MKDAVKIILFTVLAVIVTLRIFNVPVPLERDEGAYAYTAQRLDKGEIPYRDIFDHKPPLIFFAYWLAFKMFGESPVAIHVFMNLAAFFAAASIYLIAQKMFSRRVGYFASVSFLALTLSPSMQGQSANTEIFMAPFLALGLFFLYNRAYFLSGITLGIAFWFKQIAYAYIAVAAVLIVLEIFLEKRTLHGFLYFALGILLPAVLVGSYLAAYGALIDFYEDTVIFNARYATELSSKPFGIIAGRFLSAAKGIITEYILYILIALYSTWKIFEKTKEHLYLAGWLLASLIAIATGWRFFGHYFIVGAIPAAIYAGIGFDALIEKGSKLQRRWSAVGVSLLIMLILVSPFIIQEDYWRLTPQGKSRFIYGYPSNTFVEAKTVADYVAERTTNRDTIFVVGSEPEILFFSGRKNASIYTSLSPLFTGNEDEKFIKQRAVISELALNKPAYIVYVFWHPPEPSGEPNREFLLASLQNLLSSEYDLDGLVFLAQDHQQTQYIFGSKVNEKTTLEEALLDIETRPNIALFKKRPPVL